MSRQTNEFHVDLEGRSNVEAARYLINLLVMTGNQKRIESARLREHVTQHAERLAVSPQALMDAVRLDHMPKPKRAYKAALFREAQSLLGYAVEARAIDGHEVDIAIVEARDIVDDIRAISERQKMVIGAAKDFGFNTQALRIVARTSGMDAEERAEYFDEIDRTAAIL